MFRLQNAALAVWRSGGREQPPTETEKEAAQGCRRGTRHGTRPRGWDGPGRARPAASACRCGTRLAPVPSRPNPPYTLSLSLRKSQPRSAPSANTPERPLTACSPTSNQSQKRPAAVSSAAAAILVPERSCQRRREAAEGPHPSRMPDTLPDVGEGRLAPKLRHHKQKQLT